MKVLTADDEQAALHVLDRAVAAAVPDAELRSFSSAYEAVEEIQTREFRPDVAFLDIKMPGMTGLEMAKAIKNASPHTNIIFVTAFSDYALDAMALHPSGYIMKPATEEKIRVELDNLRYPPEHSSTHTIRVQCFGNFEVYRNGTPLNFPRTRDKEVLAYLVLKRGGSCTLQELAAVLYEDEPYTLRQRDRTRQLVSTMAQTLREAGAADVLVKRRNSIAVDPEAIDCDYYRFLDMDVRAINAYTGEFMSQYEWAVFTTGFLDRQK
jgi:two-component system, LytTR family, response regulator